MEFIAPVTIRHRSMFAPSAGPTGLLQFGHRYLTGGRQVDFALKLNVLAVCAAIVFVGAILLGAF